MVGYSSPPDEEGNASASTGNNVDRGVQIMKELRPLFSRTFFAVSSLAFFLLLSTSCSDGELRGKSKPSPDGQTYLVVEDDNGGACGQLFVDGEPWNTPLHEAGPVQPDAHAIACGDGASISFEIREGTTFHFDYWGP